MALMRGTAVIITSHQVSHLLHTHAHTYSPTDCLPLSRVTTRLARALFIPRDEPEVKPGRHSSNGGSSAASRFSVIHLSIVRTSRISHCTCEAVRHLSDGFARDTNLVPRTA